MGRVLPDFPDVKLIPIKLGLDCVETPPTEIIRAVFKKAESRAFKRYILGIFEHDVSALLSPLATEVAEIAG